MKTIRKSKSNGSAHQLGKKAERSDRDMSRRSFLGRSVFVGAGALSGGLFFGDATPAFAAQGLTHGDAALLRFPAALEILEADFWMQYNELGLQDFMQWDRGIDR